MSIVIGLTGVVTRDIKWVNYPRMVDGVLKDNITATFSVSAEWAYFRVTSSIPRILAFLQDNRISDVISPTRIRLAHSVSINVAQAAERLSDPNITSDNIAQRLRAANLLSNVQESELSPAETTILRCLNDSIAVANIEAHPLELLRAIGKEFFVIVKALMSQRWLDIQSKATKAEQQAAFLRVVNTAPQAWVFNVTATALDAIDFDDVQGWMYPSSIWIKIITFESITQAIAIPAAVQQKLMSQHAANVAIPEVDADAVVTTTIPVRHPGGHIFLSQAHRRRASEAGITSASEAQRQRIDTTTSDVLLEASITPTDQVPVAFDLEEDINAALDDLMLL
ncbi:hypothetical protein BX666DRAFT_2032957 [Dichotomocladium elegans]|nr:hypothetical protein BX666DRAFT_2032957 [Dichotomocladium elegans]